MPKAADGKAATAKAAGRKAGVEVVQAVKSGGAKAAAEAQGATLDLAGVVAAALVEIWGMATVAVRARALAAVVRQAAVLAVAVWRILHSLRNLDTRT